MTDRPRTPFWIRAALVISLVLNLCVVGFVVGAALRGPIDHGAAGGAQLSLRTLPRAMPEPHRGAVRDALRAERKTLRRVRRELVSLRGDLADAVAADPFEREAVEGVLREFRELLGETASIGRKAILNQLSEMSADERATFAENIRNYRSQRKRKDRRVKN